MYFCSEKEPGETRMPWSLTRPKRKDWSEFSTFRKKKNVNSLLHEVSLKDVTPPLDETPPSDRSYGEGWFSVGICKYKPGYKSHDLLQIRVL